MPIYTPKGRAGDDSPLAFNVYTSCSHRCKYCYVPGIFLKKRDDWFSDDAKPRKGLVDDFIKDFPKHKDEKKQVWLCFTNDPYGNCDPTYRATRKVLELFLKYRIPACICSKGGKRILADVDLFKKFGKHIKIGQTLTFDNSESSLEWEPGAALPKERIEVAKKLHSLGIRTFASMEPVVIPEQSLNLIRLSMPYIDEFRIGKLNNYQGMDKKIDWKKFLIESTDIVRKNKKMLYVKTDLANYYPEYLTDDEKDNDFHSVPAF